MSILNVPLVGRILVTTSYPTPVPNTEDSRLGVVDRYISDGEPENNMSMTMTVSLNTYC